MKYISLITILTILNLNSSNILAQDTNLSKYSLQLNLQLSRTLHYNQPVNLNQCIEGCFAEEQKSRITPNINFSLYRDFNKKNSLKIGLGSSSYRYFEKGMTNTGGGDFLPYESTTKWSFYSLYAGFRHIFTPLKKVKLFLENDFIYEIPAVDYGLTKNGFAIQPKIGAIINLSDNWSVIAEGFYKSGITNYKEKDFGKDYIPYAYGLQLGVNLKL